MSTLHDSEDPLAQAQQMIADARQAFARDVDGLLTEMRLWVGQVHDTSYEEMGHKDRLRALRAFVLEKFDQRLTPPRALADVVQLQTQRAQIKDLRQILQAASHALRSYEHGNASTALAKEVADAVDYRLTTSEGADA